MLHDAFFVAITTISLLGCCSVTAIVAAHRWRLRRRQPVAQTAPAGRSTPRHPPAWTGTARLLVTARAGALGARPRQGHDRAADGLAVDGRPAPAGCAARRRDPGPALHQPEVLRSGLIQHQRFLDKR
ncbi:hypothetical protein [Alicycliphilus denitrificans]|uniref:hypothetical protein n=1 Tax=Alicycliphilus denitrificans TaxID=179636 RepID=UPI0002E4839C|nr:hypothetical protein [Alicycliphilus denitrificans]